jgi:hypothetical protein
MKSTSIDQRNPTRRWFQWRLRTLLAGVTILCVMLGAVVDRAARQGRAAQWLAERGFHVRISSKAPTWLPSCLGQGFFKRFVVDGMGQGLHHISRGEVLDCGRLDSAWLFENIDLFWGAETWTLPRPPPRPPALPIGSAGELGERLTALDACRGLLLQDAHLGHDALRCLNKLSGLQHLDLRRSAIGDDDLHHLASLSNLQTLNLSETGVTDVGLRHLTSLTRLENLTLDRTAVSDAGIEHLKCLRGLRKISLDQTRFSQQGRKTLARALPDCRVDGEMPVNGL